MKSIIRFGFLILMILTWSQITSCGKALIPELASNPTGTPKSSITPTPDQIKGEFILFFVDSIVDEECKAYFPFEIKKATNGTFLEGAGKLDCSIRAQTSGEVPIMYNAVYSWNATLHGVLNPGSASYPDGVLEVNFSGPFSYKFWFTDVPPDAYNPAPKDHPVLFEANDLVPVFTNFLNGAKSESKVLSDRADWIFILHLY